MFKTTPFWKGVIHTFSKVNYSHSVLLKLLSAEGIYLKRPAISKIIKRNKDLPNNLKGTRGEQRKTRIRPSRTSDAIRKLSVLTKKENPTTQKIMANICRTSQSTVNRMIKDELNLVTKRKAKGHALTNRHINERFTHCRKLYENYLAKDRWKSIVSIDEAWIYLDDTNKPRTIYYHKKGINERLEFVLHCKEKFSKGFMVVAGYSYRGKLTIRKIPKNVKINAHYFQCNVMDAIYHNEIPQFFGNDAPKVLVHMDKASSHTARSSRQYYDIKKQETGIDVVPFSSIPVKSPDCSPMDFCGFGLLKKRLAKRRPTTTAGLWKTCVEEWNAIPDETLRKSLLQWKLRCRAIVRNRGFHIEQNRWWERGFT